MIIQVEKNKRRNSKVDTLTIETTREVGKRPWNLMVQSRVASLALDHHFDNATSNVRPPWLKPTYIQSHIDHSSHSYAVK